MESRKFLSIARLALGVSTALLILAVSTSAYAAARMYSGSIIIEAFGNDTSTGTAPPFDERAVVGIPLTGNCNTVPYHTLETLFFPNSTTPSVSFTVPAYGGAVNAIDTNGDNIPDIPVGCGTEVSVGDPLTGSGFLGTTGTPSTSRAASDPRAIGMTRNGMNKVKSGASFNRYGVYLWEVHFADLHNDKGFFSEDGGDGDFSVVFQGAQGARKAVQTAGVHQFGGVMSLLGSYGDNEAYLYNGVTTTVGYFYWLFQYLGHGGQVYNPGGTVKGGFSTTKVAYLYTRAGGAPVTSTAAGEFFKWTTGNVTVTAGEGTFPTILRRAGYDSRAPNGSGVIQLVSPMLTRWQGTGTSSTAGIGIMNLTITPEPSSAAMLAVGAVALGLLGHSQRRSRKR